MSVRAMVLTVFLVGLVGTGLELVFLDHIAGFNQLIPLVLFVMSLLVLAWHALERRSASLRAFQITMLLLLAAGFLGGALHFKFNWEFEVEGDPAMTRTELFSKALRGAAPSLAPGAMIQLGLLGLIYTFKHPVLQPTKE
jgi:hypothetical protein